MQLVYNVNTLFNTTYTMCPIPLANYNVSVVAPAAVDNTPGKVSYDSITGDINIDTDNPLPNEFVNFTVWIWARNTYGAEDTQEINLRLNVNCELKLVEESAAKLLTESPASAPVIRLQTQAMGTTVMNGGIPQWFASNHSALCPMGDYELFDDDGGGSASTTTYSGGVIQINGANPLVLNTGTFLFINDMTPVNFTFHIRGRLHTFTGPQFFLRIDFEIQCTDLV